MDQVIVIHDTGLDVMVDWKQGGTGRWVEDQTLLDVREWMDTFRCKAIQSPSVTPVITDEMAEAGARAASQKRWGVPWDSINELGHEDWRAAARAAYGVMARMRAEGK